MEKIIGTHVSFTNKQTLTDLIKSLDINYFQIYLGPKIGGSGRVLEDEDVEEASRIIGKIGFFIHSCLTNYLSCNQKYKAYCKKKILNELRHVNKFPISGVVIHVGTCNLNKVKRDLYETLDLIVKNIEDLYSNPKELGYLFIENSAGEGAKVPRTLDEISYMIKKLEKNKSVIKKIRVCIDTCHLFAAGEYNISKSSEIIKFKKDFQKKVGLKYLKLIHLNDSKDEFGSRKDRHEILGKGKIWKSPKTLSTLFECFPNIPYICETKDFSEDLKFAKKAI